MSKCVLIIEDDKNIAELLELHLKNLDCEVSVAHNGIEGFKTAVDEPFDLFLLDVNASGNGWH